MTMDRWGDSTHKMSAYNSRYKPSTRDQRQIDRMKRETMVLYPTLQPNPVLPIRSPGFSGGRGVFPRVTGGLRGLNWRAEGLRVQPPRNGLEPEREEEPSTSGFYRQQREAAPYVTRRRFYRKSPSRRPHRRMPYPPSPQYRGDSTSEDEAVQAPAAKGRYTDPTLTPIPPANMDQEESEKEEDSPGYATPPEAMAKITQQLHTALSNQLDKALQEALGKPGPEGVFLLVVWVPRMCRRFLKFAYDVVRVCMGKIYSLLVRGVSRSKTLNPLILSQSGWMLFITTINN